MAGYLINIEKATMQNDNFRKVLNTAQNSQLVVMSLLPGEEIGAEVHGLDQSNKVAYDQTCYRWKALASPELAIGISYLANASASAFPVARQRRTGLASELR